MKYLIIICLLLNNIVFATTSKNAVPPAADSVDYLGGAYNNNCATAFPICKLLVHEFDYNYDYETPQARNASPMASSESCVIQPLLLHLLCMDLFNQMI